VAFPPCFKSKKSNKKLTVDTKNLTKSECSIKPPHTPFPLSRVQKKSKTEKIKPTPPSPPKFKCKPNKKITNINKIKK